MQKRFGTKDSDRCSEYRGGHFSEVANVLQVAMGLSIRDPNFVRSRESVRFSECPHREVLLYIARGRERELSTYRIRTMR